MKKSIINTTIAKLKKEGRLVRIMGPHGSYQVLENGEDPSNYILTDQKRQDRVLALIKQNPKILIAELMEKTGLLKSIINTTISKLKKEGQLMRIGGPSGSYQVLKKGEDPSNYILTDQKRQDRVLALIKHNPKISIAELVEKTRLKKSII
ncbi:MAG: hypothetical protein OXB86_04900, partial [Bdellovibrionales bacterium]|nr:hypothetical protein [Bdellovibrionales bacterium]